MVALNMNFDASKVQPAEPGGNIWDGPVLQLITRTEIQKTASGDGSQMLILHVVAGPGPYQGQDNLIRLNLWNKSPKASERAHRELSSLCHVTNRMAIQDADQLLNIPFIGVWAKEDREVINKETGQTQIFPGCTLKDYRFADGRTIKEALNAQPAAVPFNPNAPAPTPAPAAAPAPAPQSFTPTPPAGGPGFTPAGGGSPPASMGGFAPPATGAGGFAQGGAPAPMAPHGGTPGTAPAMPTAASPSSPSPGFGGGFQPGPAPGAAPGGFAAPGAAAPGPWGVPQ